MDQQGRTGLVDQIMATQDLPELRLLRYFAMAAAEGHITRAAQRLGISQQSLSQATFDLEARLQTNLLNREVSPFTLTQAGSLLLERAPAMLQQVAEMYDEACAVGQPAASRASAPGGKAHPVGRASSG